MPAKRPPPPALSPADLKEAEARDEMNFAEFPITLLSDRSPAGLATLEFGDTIRDPQTGHEVVRRLTIDAPERFGLPTAQDDEVVLGLIQLTKLRNNFADRTVHFSRYELIHLLGWADNGASYRRLEDSLNRWVRVTLDYQRAWWNHEQKGWADEKFHVLERVSLFDSDRGRGRPALPLSLFTWNEVVFASFRAGYLKRLDLTFYLSLRHPTARRMYRFLDKRFYHRTRWEFDLTTFAFEHVGLSRSSCQTTAKGGKSYPSLSKVKEKLTPGVEELEARGFLDPMPPAERYLQVKRGEWRVVFVKKAAAARPAPITSPLERELVARGVTAKTAAELAAAHPAERVARQIDVLDWRREQPGAGEVRNPGAWLVAAVADDYAPPAGYEPKEARERKRAAAEERGRERAAVQARRQAGERNREAAERREVERRQSHIEGHLVGLTPDGRADLEAAAVAAADGVYRDMLRRDGPLAQAARRALIENEVLRVCPLPTPPIKADLFSAD